MMATRPLTSGTFGLPAGAWRWAALACVALALAAAVLALAEPQSARWAGLALLLGVGAVSGLLLYAVWPRGGVSAAEARLIAEAAAKSNVAWAVTGPDGAVLDSNPVYRRMAGAAEHEAPPPPELALAADSSSAMLYRLARSAADGKPLEESFRVAPGLEIVAAVRPLGAGKAAWWFTPRLGGADSAADAQPPSAPAPSSLFRDAPVGVAVADREGKLVEVNKAFADFFGTSALSGALKDRVLADLIDPADRESLASALARNDGTPAELRPRNAADRMAELYVNPVAGDSGRALLYLVDVSEQKALETKFAQSQKLQAVGQLAGGVAHDFNNLLTVIIGNSEFLLMRHPAGDPSFKEINEIRQTALRAANLIGQLLAFSRKQTLQPKPVLLRDTVGELAQMLRRLVGETVTLKLDQASDLWFVYADETQISNAIINLVVNARDAMPPNLVPKGGSVTIATANETVTTPVALGTAIMPAGDYVRIEVADTGIGIAKENLGKIFDPFFTTKDVGQGTGLGLATVYGIVKQTGGFITVDSELGKGTAFRIYLPRHKGEVLSQAIEAPPPRDVTGQDTILLVEDEEPVRSFTARALRMRGYNVLEAPGGEEALEIVKTSKQAIHLLITDVRMPSMDGPALVRAVKRIRPDMAVIFMSGYAEESFRRADEKTEDLHFLPKPFGLKQLAAKVKEVLSGTPPAKRVANE